MARIPTLIPESVITSLRRLFAGSFGDVLWKLGVSLALVLVGYVFLSAGIWGVFGAFVGGVLISALLEDDIRDIVSDVWNRNFWVWRV